jgi:hypothetical protein
VVTPTVTTTTTTALTVAGNSTTALVVAAATADLAPMNAELMNAAARAPQV